jgi:hypothetical protein
LSVGAGDLYFGIYGWTERLGEALHVVERDIGDTAVSAYVIAMRDGNVDLETRDEPYDRPRRYPRKMIQCKQL